MPSTISSETAIRTNATVTPIDVQTCVERSIARTPGRRPSAPSTSRAQGPVVEREPDASAIGQASPASMMTTAGRM